MPNTTPTTPAIAAWTYAVEPIPADPRWQYVLICPRGHRHPSDALFAWATDALYFGSRATVRRNNEGTLC